MTHFEKLRYVGGIIYCALVTFGFMLVTTALYFKEIPASQHDIAMVLMGALIVSFKDVGNFFTGSTASSQSKDATIAQIASNKAQP